MEKKIRIALLIDAENISQKYIKLIMNEISEYGVLTHKRVYGNFDVPSVVSWKENIKNYAMTPFFQINYTTGKSASDSAMVIDAMDILYSKKVDGFCLVTSDSDFTKLAVRLREEGMLVIGMGEQKTPNPLVAACEKFKFLDLLYSKNSNSIEEEIENKAENSKMIYHEEVQNVLPVEVKKPEAIICEKSIPNKEEIGAEITEIIDAYDGEDGWVNLATICSTLAKRVPGFDPRNYGFGKSKAFVESFKQFEVHTTKNPNNEILTVVFVKNK